MLNFAPLMPLIQRIQSRPTNSELIQDAFSDLGNFGVTLAGLQKAQAAMDLQKAADARAAANDASQRTILAADEAQKRGVDLSHAAYPEVVQPSGNAPAPTFSDLAPGSSGQPSSPATSGQPAADSNNSLEQAKRMIMSMPTGGIGSGLGNPMVSPMQLQDPTKDWEASASGLASLLGKGIAPAGESATTGASSQPVDASLLSSVATAGAKTSPAAPKYTFASGAAFDPEAMTAHELEYNRRKYLANEAVKSEVADRERASMLSAIDTELGKYKNFNGPLNPADEARFQSLLDARDSIAARLGAPAKDDFFKRLGQAAQDQAATARTGMSNDASRDVARINAASHRYSADKSLEGVKYSVDARAAKEQGEGGLTPAQRLRESQLAESSQRSWQRNNKLPELTRVSRFLKSATELLAPPGKDEDPTTVAVRQREGILSVSNAGKEGLAATDPQLKQMIDAMDGGALNQVANWLLKQIGYGPTESTLARARNANEALIRAHRKAAYDEQEARLDEINGMSTVSDSAKEEMANRTKATISKFTRLLGADSEETPLATPPASAVPNRGGAIQSTKAEVLTPEQVEGLQTMARNKDAAAQKALKAAGLSW